MQVEWKKYKITFGPFKPYLRSLYWITRHMGFNVDIYKPLTQHFSGFIPTSLYLGKFFLLIFNLVSLHPSPLNGQPACFLEMHQFPPCHQEWAFQEPPLYSSSGWCLIWTARSLTSHLSQLKKSCGCISYLFWQLEARWILCFCEHQTQYDPNPWNSKLEVK